jgi:hypothetical protein
MARAAVAAWSVANWVERGATESRIRSSSLRERPVIWSSMWTLIWSRATKWSGSDVGRFQQL